ncbi:hypothetical protein CVU82_03955 [Candidatus Falkowbacteria bacterium HGW-Falkowbacteria-1]|uniref:Glycosyltransferase 2-like domain-containing protein n=1 Tax=Candidatus Falkowbacteria bacterium HGW-Falkowbacteria-1 TaxID=2013768 RepID=A0A2N2E924_9BACT|nr:MAG: hypothetical protein CVU82_03955 [Candidatus Falkowbacteria bacterium HGW-Falkowbacteria-1]
MTIDFIIPAYNEEQLLEKNITKLFDFLNLQNYNFDWKINIIINGSNDNSEKIAKKITNKNIGYEVIKEAGKGNAIITTMDKSSADFFVYMDIDLAVSLENINDLVKELLLENDFVIGSRLLAKSVRKRSLTKDIISKTYVLLSKIILGHNFSDLQCGFKAIKRSAFIKIRPFIEDNKWFFDTEFIIFAKLLDLKIKEIPVNWSENRYEKRKSKLKLLRNSLLFTNNLFKLKKRLNKIASEKKRTKR